MAKGILLVLGGSDAGTFSALNTILYGVGNILSHVPAIFGAWFMYIFQSLFNLVVTSNSGQAALTMPIMAPLARNEYAATMNKVAFFFLRVHYRTEVSTVSICPRCNLDDTPTFSGSLESSEGIGFKESP